MDMFTSTVEQEKKAGTKGMSKFSARTKIPLLLKPNFDYLSHLSSDTYIKSESSLPDISLHNFDINNQEHIKKQTDHIGASLELSLLPEENTAKNVIEAGLWLEVSQKDNVPISKVQSDFVRNLETIEEESMEMHLSTFSESTINASESLSVKLERSEIAGAYIEISPPKSQLDMFTSTVEQEKKAGIKGWSKFSARTKKPLQLKPRKGKNLIILGALSSHVI